MKQQNAPRSVAYVACVVGLFSATAHAAPGITSGINAAVEMADGKAYFFRGSNYLRFDLAMDRADAGYPRPICQDFVGLPPSWCQGIDAAMLGHGGGKVYLFKGSEYVLIPTNTKTASSPPRPIAEAFPGVFPDGLDAAVNGNNGSAYFFKGPIYARFNFVTRRVDDGYPKPITGNWHGFPPSFGQVPGPGIDASFNGLAGKLYFFKGTEYVRYNLSADVQDSGYPAAIPVGFRGLDRLLALPVTPPAPPVPPVPVPPVVPPPTVEFLDASQRARPFVQIGLWDNAFLDDAQACDAPNGVGKPLNRPNERDNFVGADSRRYYVQVTDPSAAGRGRLALDLWTETPGRRQMLDLPADPSVPLVEVAGRPGVFRTPALLLVSDPWELANVKTTDGLGGASLIGRGQSGYRLRAANLAAEVVVRYRRSQTESHRKAVPVFERTPDFRKVLPIQFYVLIDPAHPAPALPALRKELSFMRQAWARAGIHITTTLPSMQSVDPDSSVLQVDTDQVILVNTPQILQKPSLSELEVKAIATRYPSVDPFRRTLRVFFVGQMAVDSCGVTKEKLAPNGCYYGSDPLADDAVFVSHWNQVGSTSAAHEIGHALGLPHMETNPPAGGRASMRYNLMQHPPQRQHYNTACYPGRLWDLADPQPVFGQMRTVHTSRFLRPFASVPGAARSLFPLQVGP